MALILHFPNSAMAVAFLHGASTRGRAVHPQGADLQPIAWQNPIVTPPQRAAGNLIRALMPLPKSTAIHQPEEIEHVAGQSDVGE